MFIEDDMHKKYIIFYAPTFKGSSTFEDETFHKNRALIWITIIPLLIDFWI